MATKEQVDAARLVLKNKWDSMGSCGSCGWHGLLYEHNVEDSDIAYAIDNDAGMLWLPCVTKDDDNAGHRGISIFLLPGNTPIGEQHGN